ncbi:glycyl-radical enzyme activating protein [Clostridium sp. D2Q-14]|uniref:trans-4-hydroxy-L-proline dehydratase activase n=1 Tax=Anaeromonas gelatinilytica TaxID=2683194 RepID=UPI00193AE3FD|nr:trans-4-hydroxy-L-proline dehydratase activase [Anaeromonas gelatinilytica]MBS4536344.1 glycyl-radical enzyme activating protein [Anaeromonas gelatinilytica]
MSKGMIMNIQKYSVHDGPGIRTTVFFKGCPLSCWWCHNPESQNFNSDLMFFRDKCSGCGRCEERCPERTIKMESRVPIRDEDKCTLCGKCADLCLNEGWKLVGRKFTSSELMKEIKKDEIFYEESGGGVTFSGGEPLSQIDFLEEMLKKSKTEGVHTTVDTSGYSKWENIKKIVDYTDLFLYDLKLLDDERHKKYIGVSNKNILKNLEKLSETGANIYVRIPIIKGINDDMENIEGTIKFLEKLNISQVNLLPYHRMGMEKYERLSKEYNLIGDEKPSEEEMDNLVEKFKILNRKIKVGG